MLVSKHSLPMGLRLHVTLTGSWHSLRARTAGTLSEKIKIYGYMMDVFIRYVCVCVKSPKGSIVEMALKVGGTFKANCY